MITFILKITDSLFKLELIKYIFHGEKTSNIKSLLQ